MWKNLLRLLVLNSTLLTGLCAAALSFKSDQPRPTFADYDGFGFGRCTLPCYAGVEPGDTPFENASALVVANIPLLDARMYISGSTLNFWSYGTETRLSGMIRYQNGLVGSIRLNLRLPNRWIIDQLGTPDCVIPGQVNAGTSLHYSLWQRGGISIGAATEGTQKILNLNASAISFWIGASDQGECALAETIKWQGFAPAWRYEQLQNRQIQ